MQAASRQSYAAARERLNAYADGADPQELRTVSDELLAVARLLAGQVPLRRALADPSRAGDERAALLRGLLGRQISEQTGALLDALVSGRWSTAHELLDGCEQLAVQALLASAEREDVLGEVEDELFRFSQVAAGDPELAAVLGDRRAPLAPRARLVEDLLADRAHHATVALVQVALGGFGGRSVDAALTRLVEFAAQRRDRSVAYVTVATALSEDDEHRLGSVLSTRYGRNVSVKTTVDPRVLGGARVQVGADLYDGTVAHRLAQARNALATR